MKAERECRKSGRWKRLEHESEYERGEQENLNEFERLSQTANGEFEAEGEEVVLIRRRQVLSGFHGFDNIIIIIRHVQL